MVGFFGFGPTLQTIEPAPQHNTVLAYCQKVAGVELLGYYDVDAQKSDLGRSMHVQTQISSLTFWSNVSFD